MVKSSLDTTQKYLHYIQKSSENYVSGNIDLRMFYHDFYTGSTKECLIGYLK